jgi:hypothetical protein
MTPSMAWLKETRRWRLSRPARGADLRVAAFVCEQSSQNFLRESSVDLTHPRMKSST